MAKIRILVATDIIIDFLKGVKPAMDIFRLENFDIYCSILSKKELISKIGLKDSEKKRIISLLSKIKVLKIDTEITSKYQLLIKKYGEKSDSIVDYLIASTAWSKNLPILTRNSRHFEYIKEVKLCPTYNY